MAFSFTCDGLKRRDFLRVGALGTGLSLAPLHAVPQAVRPPRPPQAPLSRPGSRPEQP